MPVTIHVQNFQSLEDVKVTVDGFTAITGRNNSGKTALMRAVRCVFSNSWNDSYIRHGADSVRIEIDFGDGNKVVREKGKGVNKYTVTTPTEGEQVFEKLGRGEVPPEVAALGVRPVQLGPDTVWPQIAQQLTDVVFLLNKPGDRIAEAVSDFDRVTKLSRALKVSESDRRKSNDTLKVRQQDAADLEEELKLYEGLDDLVADVCSLEVLHQQAVENRSSIEQLQDFSSRFTHANQQVADLDGIEEDSEGIPTEKELASVHLLVADLEWLAGKADRLTRLNKAIEAVSFVEGIKVPPEDAFTKAEKAQEKLEGVRELAERLCKADATVERYEGFKGVVEPKGLDEVVAKAEELRGEIDTLRDLRQRLWKASTDFKTQEGAVQQAGEDLVVAQQEVAELLGDLEECPVCGTVVEAHPC